MSASDNSCSVPLPTPEERAKHITYLYDHSTDDVVVEAKVAAHIAEAESSARAKAFKEALDEIAEVRSWAANQNEFTRLDGLYWKVHARAKEAPK